MPPGDAAPPNASAADPARVIDPGLSPRELRRQVHRELRESGLFEDLREEYVRLLQGSRHCFEHIRRLSQWAGYVYYCRFLAQWVPDRDARIVDWGGHFGQVTELLRRMGYTNVVNYMHFRPAELDGFSAEDYEPFRAHFGLPTVVGDDPVQIALEDESCDVCISSGVLEHVREDGVATEKAALDELWRVLRPGGLLFLWNFPTRWGTSELLAIALGRWHHRFRYRRREVVSLLEGSRFRIRYLDKHKFLPGSVADRLGRFWSTAGVMRCDDAVSRWPPMSWFARDFGAVAVKDGR